MAKTENNTNIIASFAPYPAFDKHNINMRFVQLEAIFVTRKITSQATKFATLVPALPPSIVEEVADILESVPEHEPYTHLKEVILKHTGRSDEETLRGLFRNVTMGDRTSSQLLRHMKTTLGQHKMAEPILRGLWMEKLPSIITQILASMVGHLSLNQQADSADKIFSDGKNIINQVHTPTGREESWMKAIAALQKQIEQLQLTMRSRPRSTSPFQGNNKSRPRSSSRKRHEDRDICNFHKKFGSRASKCQPPCKYRQNQEKRHNQQVMATNTAGMNPRCRLFY